jgi:hypothetical protein
MLAFEPMRIKVDTNLIEEGTEPLEVFFLIEGCVESVKTGKLFA